MSASPTAPDTDPETSVEALIRQMIAGAAAERETASLPPDTPPAPLAVSERAAPRESAPRVDTARPSRRALAGEPPRPARRRPPRAEPRLPRPDDTAAPCAANRVADEAQPPGPDDAVATGADAPGTAEAPATTGPILRVVVGPRRGLRRRRPVAIALESGGYRLESAIVRRPGDVAETAAWIVGRARRCGTICPAETVEIMLEPAGRASPFEAGLREAVAAALRAAPRCAPRRPGPAPQETEADDLAALVGADEDSGRALLPLVLGAATLGSGILVALMLV
ncbi:hypothetical protein DLJ49_13080 [Rhodovulum sp. 12E13]|uniref:hypothetical protein n=1 Tax=Rhodovulum sp. 12E13 TaxID=2203891 RepID=UPI000E17C3F7|nr:hypothetical protein [Rhodovulum sp. 12E13]RDC71787.1 hypothetical protein DLJ49_13080 [Rhodovulum sp. 12E13]